MRTVAHVCLLLFVWPTVAWASPVPWKSLDYFKVANNQPVAELLREFAADQGLAMVVSDKVSGTMSGRFGPQAPAAFLDQVTQSNGLVWYFDGHAIYVYRSDELQSEIISAGAAPPQQLVDTLRELGLLSDRYPLKRLDDHNLIYIVGPPRYVEMVTKTAEKIAESVRARAQVEVVVEVFPLRYAWADNQTLFLGGTQVVVPGVATVLRNLASNQPTGIRGRYVQQVPYNLPSLRGFGMIGPENRAIQQAQQAAVNAEIAAAQATARSTSQREGEAASPIAEAAAAVQGVIDVDPRLNAVVVRDLKERMPSYQSIIEELDRPSDLVQIQAVIIDVDADAGFQWGPPYHAKWQSGQDIRRFNLQLNATDAANLSLSLSDNLVEKYLAELRALETEGQARLVTKPTVLTVDNQEAFVDSTEEFYVRVPGFEQSDLFNVNVGTTMRILPHVVLDSQQSLRQVKLGVFIQDGRITANTVDDIPIVARNTVHTQAVLREGESLLIGGLMREELTKTEKRIPVLGRVPHLGTLFKTIDNETRKFERLVLITPTIISLSASVCPPGPGGNANPYTTPFAPQELLPPPVSTEPLTVASPPRDSGWRSAVMPAGYEAAPPAPRPPSIPPNLRPR